MENRKNNLSVEDVKAMDLVDFLATLNFHPVRISAQDFWYLSPLRDEKTPSFKINRLRNVWYDHGLGRGGNIIVFGMLFYKCTFTELMERLSDQTVMNIPPSDTVASLPSFTPPPTPVHRVLEITAKKPLAHFALLRYLQERRIPLPIASGYCKEIHYTVEGRKYFGIGFENDEGGFEVRNPYAKIAAPPKSFRSIRNGGNTVYVFEGFFDFLSFLTIYPQHADFPRDYLILNSLSLFEKARDFMLSHGRIKLFLDHDNAGRKWTSIARSWGTHVEDESAMYAGYKDLNQWLTNFGNGQDKPVHQ